MNVGALFSQPFMLLATSNFSCASACPNAFTPDCSPVHVFVRISESSLLLSFVRATKYFVSLPVNAILFYLLKLCVLDAIILRFYFFNLRFQYVDQIIMHRCV